MKMHRIFAGMSAAALGASVLMAVIPAAAAGDATELTWTVTDRTGNAFSNSVEITKNGTYSITVDYGSNNSVLKLGDFSIGDLQIKVNR